MLFKLLALLLILFKSSYGLSSTATILDNHHTNDQLLEIIDRVHAKCPDITYVYDLHERSLNNFPLRVIVFSDNPSVHEIGEPEFKFVANMHGNEVVGRELMLELMVQLCDDYIRSRSFYEESYSQDQTDWRSPMITRQLIESTRIHILASMNPDGWNKSVSDEFKRLNMFDSLEDMLQLIGVTDPLNGRDNMNNIDLNRNFPDLASYYFKYEHMRNKLVFTRFKREIFDILKYEQRDCLNQPFQPESLAVLKWIVKTPFVLSANFHGGSLVANYPFDSNKENLWNYYTGTQDDSTFRFLATTYAKFHLTMPHKSKSVCIPGEVFENGITNGAAWYTVCGSMQDFNYLASNCLELTLEIGCNKFPPGNTLRSYWNENVGSIVNYMWMAHAGVKGLVLDSQGKQVSNAYVLIEKETPHGFKPNLNPMITTQDGEYWRILEPGVYRIWAIKNSLKTSKKLISVSSRMYQQAQIIDLHLDF